MRKIHPVGISTEFGNRQPRSVGTGEHFIEMGQNLTRHLTAEEQELLNARAQKAIEKATSSGRTAQQA